MKTALRSAAAAAVMLTATAALANDGRANREAQAELDRLFAEARAEEAARSAPRASGGFAILEPFRAILGRNLRFGIADTRPVTDADAVSRRLGGPGRKIGDR